MRAYFRASHSYLPKRVIWNISLVGYFVFFRIICTHDEQIIQSSREWSELLYEKFSESMTRVKERWLLNYFNHKYVIWRTNKVEIVQRTEGRKKERYKWEKEDGSPTISSNVNVRVYKCSRVRKKARKTTQIMLHFAFTFSTHVNQQAQEDPLAWCIN